MNTCKICGEALEVTGDGQCFCPSCGEVEVGEIYNSALTFPELDLTDDDLEFVANLLYDTSISCSRRMRTTI